jgi:Acetyltransferase (GNAT) family
VGRGRATREEHKTPYEIFVQPITDDDRDLCSSFACGDEPWEREVTEFITETYWKGGRPPSERTLLAFTEDGEFVGFGTWKFRELTAGGHDYGRVIDIAWLGLTSRFKGEVDHDGHKLATRLYAALDDDARQAPEATEDMATHLVCDERNLRARAFFERELDFEEIERKYIPALDVTYINMVRP